MSTCCSHETLLHISLQNYRLNIRYYHQDLLQELFNRNLRQLLRDKPHALLHSAIYRPSHRSGISHTLERHPFSGLVHSAGELLHTPWRISTSMTTDMLFK